MSKDLVAKTIEDVVTRARLGDQVASATLVIIGQRADKGERRAIEIRDKVLEYTRRNPQQFQQSVVFGLDRPVKEAIVGDACMLKRNLCSGRYTGAGLAILLLTLGDYAVGVLAHGPTLLKEMGQPNAIVLSVRNALQNDHLASVFDMGNETSNEPEVMREIAKDLSPEEQRAFSLGSIIGRARRLQAVTNPNVPLSVLCSKAAWELDP
jgi:hypothetical protein